MSTLPTPPGVNIHASRQPSLYTSTIITWILAIAAVLLRFYSRKLTKSGYRIDDWLVIAAILLSTGFSADMLVWTRQGFGLHYEILGPDLLSNYSKTLFVGEITYTLALCFAKYSILAFYRRIFATTIKIPVYVVGALVTAWGIAVILVSVFQCDPPSGFWNRKENTVCTVDDKHFFIGNAVPNVVTDVAMLSLPVPFIVRLHQTNSHKIALVGMFMLGGFITIISVVRLIIVVNVDLKSPDLDWNMVPVCVWTVTESNVAVICACLPSLRPILSLIRTMTESPDESRYPKNTSTRSKISNLYSKKRESRSRYHGPGDTFHVAESQRGFVPLHGEPACTETFVTTANSAGSKQKSDFDRDIEMQGTGRVHEGIHVRTETSVY